MTAISNNQKLCKLIVFLALLLIIAGCDTASPADDPPRDGALIDDRYLQIELAGQEFTLELALNDRQRARGLMGREEIADDGGMLFVMPPVDPFPTELVFWMKDCLIPIDIIFLSEEGVITATHEIEPPEPGVADEELPRYSSNSPAQFAIELRGGRVAELGFTVGDQIKLPFEMLLELAE